MTKLERPALFIGGKPEMMRFINHNIAYPEDAIENNLQGKVYILFLINEQGNAVNHKVLKGVHELLDAEVLRVVKLMTTWIPGIYKGSAAIVEFILPINFQLN